MREFWNEKYEEEGYFFGLKPNSFVASTSHLIKSGGSVLTIGEGEGRNAVFLAEQGFQVAGVDVSDKGREKALAFAEDRGVSFDYILEDLMIFDFGQDKWDAIIACFAHTPEEVRKSMLEKLEPSLKAGGLFILEGFNVKQLEIGQRGPKSPDIMFYLDELKRAFKHSDIILGQEIIRKEDIKEKGEHNCAVTQFIARKL